MHLVKKIYPLLLIIYLLPLNLNATHNRAGEITYRQISGLTYEITITTFTYQLSNADRNVLPVIWGDGSQESEAQRIQKLSLPNFYYKNVYTARHTYPGPGEYEIVVQDPNRNFGVENIPNSVNVIFSIKTTLIINPLIGSNSTPVLLNAPIDRAVRGYPFIHNPGAFDYDGDSLSYSLTVCTAEDGEPIEDYEFPEASDTLYVDPITGDLVWDSPVDSGIFNIAMNVTEWRKGIRIGNITRDMQIEVYNVNNRPPVNAPLNDYCIIAGDSIRIRIETTDRENDFITHTITGGPFIFEDSAYIDTTVQDTGRTVSYITWKTNCSHVRPDPYNILVKAEDDNFELKLVDIDQFKIRVIAPPVTGLGATSTSNAVNLSWSPHECSQVSGYEIYRSQFFTGFEPDSCTTGVPEETGYIKIGETNNFADTTFMDNDEGKGLQQGFDYCYIIIAVFENGARSMASAEICQSLVAGSPSLLSASVTEISESNGSVFVSWAKPSDLDSIPATGPYEYIISRANQLWGGTYTEINRFKTADLNDTTFTDENINTTIFPYSYRVELFNDAPDNRFLIGSPEVASTTYPEAEVKDNGGILYFRKNVPWIDSAYVIYQKTNGGIYDSVAVSYRDTFFLEGLQNNVEYCYRTKAIGYRNLDSVQYNTLNWSHEVCFTPVDTFPPCPPELSVTSYCDSLYNDLIWTNPNNTCADDVVSYNLYYSPLINAPSVLLETFDPDRDTTYRHFPDSTLAACYYVTAVDSFGNESAPSERVCVDVCTDYELPNYFTPNGDNQNDYFRPGPYTYVEFVDMKIFNRWGNLVYETSDPDIMWDGKIMGTNKLASPGVYFYICDVYERRLTGLEVRNLVGFVYLFTDGTANPPPPAE